MEGNIGRKGNTPPSTGRKPAGVLHMLVWTTFFISGFRSFVTVREIPALDAVRSGTGHAHTPGQTVGREPTSHGSGANSSIGSPDHTTAE
jgi:hypothetical protein